MKKIIIAAFLILVSILVATILYNYFLTEKITNEFIEGFIAGEKFQGHPQESLILELGEVGLNEDIVDYTMKYGIRRFYKEIVFEREGVGFKLQLSIEKNANGERIPYISGINIVNGYLMEKQNEGASFNYIIKKEKGELALSSPLNLDLSEGDVVRLIVAEGVVLGFSPLEEVNISKVLSYDAHSVKGEVEGTFKFDPELTRFGVESRLFVGQKNIDLYLRDDHVIGLVAREEFIPDTIRVLINDTGFNNLHHEYIELYSDGNISLQCKVTGKKAMVDSKEHIRFVKGEEGIKVTIGNKNYQFQHRVYVKSGDLIYFNTIKRGANNNLSLGYRGNFEVFIHEESLYLINELPLEQYLYGVVPSEMPASFGLEALKIQAIAARTYAINNLYASPYRKYTAHVVDSVLNQVYNNTYEHPITNKGVDATSGKVIAYDGNIIDAKFFSTSSGFTANAHEVWELGGQFPAKEIPYLKSKPQGLKETITINTEKDFLDFITNYQLDSYDSNSPFFRWKIKMTEEQLRKSIEANLASRHAAQPNSVLTFDGHDYVSMDIPPNPIGKLKEIKVIKRGHGGNIMVLDIVSANGTYRIEKEYNIRFTIRPICDIEPVKIWRIDDSTLDNYSILPSAFIYFKQQFNDDYLEKVTIHGGGNGHGAGMSQYGVLGMIEKGYDIEKIIGHYYEGAEIKRLY